MTENPQYEVAVIGGGPGGIAAGAKLMKAGIENFVVIERAADLGGSWHENDYPGIGVDIPAVAYQYSFARNARWSRLFPKGAEVKQYHVDVARRFGVYERTRFNANVVKESWDDRAALWRLSLADGDEITARFLISAVGAFVRPKEDVGIKGVKTFKGKIQRPTDWDHEFDLAGKTVAVVGTGASAVQIIPSIAPEVAHLTVFQRTPVWSVPKPDVRVAIPAQAALAIPGVQPAIHGSALVVLDALFRALANTPPIFMKPILRAFDASTIAAYRQYLKLVIEDDATREKLTPNFGLVAKRPTMSNGYLQSYNRDNVLLVTEPIERITPRGVKTANGVVHQVDVLVLATGYEVFSDPETYLPGTVVGRAGFDLAEFYAEHGLQAYESVSVHGLPNRWTLVGPYSWTGSGWHSMVEMTADHAVRAISEARRRGTQVCEIREDAARRYHADVTKRAESFRYYLADLNAHVSTYYRNSQGETTYLRPSGFFEARRGNRRFPLDDYTYVHATAEDSYVVRGATA